MARWARVIVAVVCGLGLAVPSAAQDIATGRVSGFARHADDTPVIDARMRLRSTSTGQIVSTVRTLPNGEFLFTAPPGAYVVELVTANGRATAVGAPFALGAGQTVSTFVRVGATRSQAAPAGPRPELSLGAQAVWRDGTRGGAPGGSVAGAMNVGRVAVLAEIGGVRRAGHNDWRTMGGVRLWLADGVRGGVFVTGKGGGVWRSATHGPSFAAGVGGDLRGRGPASVRLTIEAVRDRVVGRWANAVRGTVWVVFGGR